MLAAHADKLAKEESDSPRNEPEPGVDGDDPTTLTLHEINKRTFAAIDARLSDGNTFFEEFLLQKEISKALVQASHEGHVDVVRFLWLEAATDWRVKEQAGEALEHAAGKGHYEIVELLLSSEVGEKLLKGHGPQALAVASEQRYHRIVELLQHNSAESCVRALKQSGADVCCDA